MNGEADTRDVFRWRQQQREVMEDLISHHTHTHTRSTGMYRTGYTHMLTHGESFMLWVCIINTSMNKFQAEWILHRHRFIYIFVHLNVWSDSSLAHLSCLFDHIFHFLRRRGSNSGIITSLLFCFRENETPADLKHLWWFSTSPKRNRLGHPKKQITACLY